MKRSQHKVPLTWCLQSFIPWPSSADGVAKLSWKWFSCYDMAGDKFIGPCGKYLFVTLLFPWSKMSLACNRFFSSVLTVLPLISTTCKVLVCPDRKSQGSLANPGINGRAALPPEPQICYVCNKIEKFWDTIAIHAYYSCRSLQKQQTTNLSELSSDFSRVSDSD